MSKKDFEPVYQEGKADVEHKNLDAAGSDNPLGDSPMAFQASDMRRLIRKIADKLYQSWEAFIREYLANAETACLRTKHFVEDNDTATISVDSLYGIDDSYDPRIEVTWDRSENRLTIRDNGIGMASQEVDEIFREISNSAVRDYGEYSGMFGMGVLSFPKFSGVYDSGLLMSHSRQTDENYAAYVSLAGVEPLMGQMPENEYGTKFQFTAQDDYDVRSAVEKYAEWIRVPVIYRERDEDGTEVFNEDYGNKKLTDKYGTRDITMTFDEYDEYFEAYCSDKSTEETLLLSMPIERNGTHETIAPFNFDVRFYDESGVIFKSSNGNEGCSPIPRGDYKKMLLDAREEYVPESMIEDDSDIVLGQEVVAGTHEGMIAINNDTLESGVPLPQNDYVAREDLTEDDEPGRVIVLAGNDGFRGKTVISDDDWNSLDAGRAENYVPEDEVESYDIETGEGDLQLPEPTSNRESLQSNDVFWKWLARNFKSTFERMVFDVHDAISPTETPAKDIQELDEEEIVKGIVEDTV